MTKKKRARASIHYIPLTQMQVLQVDNNFAIYTQINRKVRLGSKTWRALTLMPVGALRERGNA